MGTIHSSMRLYYESKRTPAAPPPRTTPSRRALRGRGVPGGGAEPALRAWVARGYDLRPAGPRCRAVADFAAMEEPDLLAEDVREFLAGR